MVQRVPGASRKEYRGRVVHYYTIRTDEWEMSIKRERSWTQD